MTELNTAKKSYEMDDNKLEALAEMCAADLEGKMEIIAGVTQEFILSGCESPLIAAIVKDEYFCFLPIYEIGGLDDKEAVRQKILDLAVEHDADCVVVGGAAWSAPDATSPRPSLHPRRSELVIVMARDASSHLLGSQKIVRRGDAMTFGDLQITSRGRTWLDDFSPNHSKVASN